MKTSFALRLPISPSELGAAEEYTRGVVYADVSAGTGERAQRIVIRDEEGATQTCVQHQLRQWLDDGLQALLGGAALRFALYETRYPDNALYQSIFSRNFPRLSAFVFRRATAAVETYYSARATRIDVLSESTPLLTALGDRVAERLEEAIGEQTDGVELLFDLYIDSGYGLANEYLLGVLANAFRLYLTYFYKSLLLFRPRWHAGALPPPPRDNGATRLAEFSHVVRSYNDFKLRTAFLRVARQLPALAADANCPAQVFREGALLKRGDGPIDFKWNERYFVLFADRLLYLRTLGGEERGQLELRGTLLGDIAPFDGMPHALLLSHARSQRRLWLGSHNRAELVAWRRRLADLLVGHGTELSGEESFAVASPTPKGTKKAAKELEAVQRAPADAKLVARCAALRSLAEKPNLWRYYKMKNGVKISICRENPKSLNSQIKFALLSFGVLLLAAFWRFSIPKILIFVCFPFAIAFLAAFVRQRKVFLCGALTIERSPKAVLDFLGDPHNLQSWNGAFHRVEPRTLTHFRASERFAPGQLRLTGEFGVEGAELYLHFGNGGFDVCELLRVGSVCGAPQLARLFLFSVTKRRCAMARLLGEAEERVAALALIEDEMAAREKRALGGAKLGLRESELFFLQGAPFYSQPIASLAIEKDQIRALREQRRPPTGKAATVCVQAPQEAFQRQSFAATRIFLDELFEPLFFHRPAPPFRRLPPSFFGRRSLFEVFAGTLAFCPAYLSLAASEESEEERMRLCLAALLGGLTTLGQLDRLPLIPYRGETLQAFWRDGTALDFEQLDEGAFAFAVEGGRQDFRISGRVQLHCDVVGNAVRLRSTEPLRIFLARGAAALEPTAESDDCDCFEFVCPTVHVFGLFFGPHAIGLDGSGTLTSIASHTVCAFEATQLETNHKALRCAELQPTESCAAGLAVSGQWPLSVEFGAEQYWKFDLVAPLELALAERYLPSDIRRREASYFLAQGMQRQAEAAHFEEARRQYIADASRRDC